MTRAWGRIGYGPRLHSPARIVAKSFQHSWEHGQAILRVARSGPGSSWKTNRLAEPGALRKVDVLRKRWRRTLRGSHDRTATCPKAQEKENPGMSSKSVVTVAMTVGSCGEDVAREVAT